jgi:WD40 repeat protein
MILGIPVGNVAFAPDGRTHGGLRAAGCSSGKGTRDPLASPLSANDKTVESVTLGADATLATGADDGTARVWLGFS